MQIMLFVTRGLSRNIKGLTNQMISDPLFKHIGLHWKRFFSWIKQFIT